MKYADKRADLRAQMPLFTRKALIITLEFLLLASLAFVQTRVKKLAAPEAQVTIQVEDIPITKQEIKKQRKAPKIAIPIAAEKEEVPDTVTIDNTELIDTGYVPPPPKEEEAIDFFAVEKKPEIIKRVEPVYPELARQSGTEGAVLLEIVIGKDGSVESAKVIQARPKGVFEDVAIAAVKQWKFSPAMQRDRPVRVKMQIPIKFTLK